VYQAPRHKPVTALRGCPAKGSDRLAADPYGPPGLRGVTVL
jgi:hypothetical protein